MACQATASCHFCGLPWAGYVCCEEWQSSQPKYNDIEMNLSQYYEPYCESLASSSSFPDFSMSGSIGVTSASSSASDVDCAHFTEQRTGNFRGNDPSAIRSGLFAAGRINRSDGNGYIDPRLAFSDIRSCSNRNISNHKGDVTSGGGHGQGLYNDFRTLLTDQASSLQDPINDFDIALRDIQPVISAFTPGVNLWLQAWVATNPQKFPNTQEVESLKILSGLPEAEIMASLSRHGSTQVTSEAKAMDKAPTITDAEQNSSQTRVPRYRPKCRKSRRRFRYVAKTPDATRKFECTYRCGLSFARKGQWARHESYNFEEWKCHLCDFVSARKDKLHGHLRKVHSIRGGTRKSHCRQLLQPSSRLCGFCLNQFDNWSDWLNHVSAHFEGHIAGGPWTMARWNRAVDPDFGSGENDDDNDDDEDDDDQIGDDDDQADPDYDSSATDHAGDSSNKDKDASHGSGSASSSKSSNTSRSKSSSSRRSKSHNGASKALSYLQQDYYKSQSDGGSQPIRSHTMSPLKQRKAELVRFEGEGNRVFLRRRKPDRPVLHTCSPKDSVLSGGGRPSSWDFKKKDYSNPRPSHGNSVSFEPGILDWIPFAGNDFDMISLYLGPNPTVEPRKNPQVSYLNLTLQRLLTRRRLTGTHLPLPLCATFCSY
jgi:hypothetical protein